MKIIILWLAILSILLAGAGFAGKQESKIQFVNTSTLKTWMDKAEKVTVINVGSLLACTDVKIPGSLCMPCDQAKDAFHFSSVPKENKLVFYAGYEPFDPECGLIRNLQDRGSRDVYILEGGLVAWRRAGFPVVSEKRIPRVAAHAIKPKSLPLWQKTVKNPLVIDIRSPKAYAAGHLDGSLNFPLSRLHMQYGDIPLDRTLLIIDDDGHAGFLAASYLNRKGFSNVQRLQGGMAAYKRGTK